MRSNPPPPENTEAPLTEPEPEPEVFVPPPPLAIGIYQGLGLALGGYPTIANATPAPNFDRPLPPIPEPQAPVIRTQQRRRRWVPLRTNPQGLLPTPTMAPFRASPPPSSLPVPTTLSPRLPLSFLTLSDIGKFSKTPLGTIVLSSAYTAVAALLIYKAKLKASIKKVWTGILITMAMGLAVHEYKRGVGKATWSDRYVCFGAPILEELLRSRFGFKFTIPLILLEIASQCRTPQEVIGKITGHMFLHFINKHVGCLAATSIHMMNNICCMQEYPYGSLHPITDSIKEFFSQVKSLFKSVPSYQNLNYTDRLWFCRRFDDLRLSDHTLNFDTFAEMTPNQRLLFWPMLDASDQIRAIRVVDSQRLLEPQAIEEFAISAENDRYTDATNRMLAVINRLTTY